MLRTLHVTDLERLPLSGSKGERNERIAFPKLRAANLAFRGLFR
jgi:hypothetical protein